MKTLVPKRKARTRSEPAAKAEPAFMKTIRKLARARDWPADYALNHGHHAKGQTAR